MPRELRRTGGMPLSAEEEDAGDDEEKAFEADPLLDFPREMKDRLEALAREPRYMEALEVKDRMLWEVLESHRKLEEELEKKKARKAPRQSVRGRSAHAAYAACVASLSPCA